MLLSSELLLTHARRIRDQHNWNAHDGERVAKLLQAKHNDLDGHFLYVVMCFQCTEPDKSNPAEKYLKVMAHDLTEREATTVANNHNARLHKHHPHAQALQLKSDDPDAPPRYDVVCPYCDEPDEPSAKKTGASFRGGWVPSDPNETIIGGPK